MTAFGQDLKAQRERLGLSLEALAAETKVVPRHLEALEEDHFEQLPGGVFRRGIVRAYLHAVHLEEEPWMQRFQAALDEEAQRHGRPLQTGDDAWVTFAENVKRGRASSQASSGTRWLGVLLLLLIVLGAALATWRFVLHGRFPWQRSAPATAIHPADTP